MHTMPMVLAIILYYGKMVTGQSFFETHQQPFHTTPTLHLVQPACRRRTNTITQAGLSAIAAALDHASHSFHPSITQSTDSLAAIYLIMHSLHTSRILHLAEVAYTSDHSYALVTSSNTISLSTSSLLLVGPSLLAPPPTFPPLVHYLGDPSPPQVIPSLSFYRAPFLPLRRITSFPTGPQPT